MAIHFIIQNRKITQSKQNNMDLQPFLSFLKDRIDEFNYSGVRVIVSRFLHEICLLIGELAIRGTKLKLNARLGTENNLLIEQLLLGEHYCMYSI